MKKWDDATVADILKVDSLAVAEKITGKSYKEDEDTSKLGLALHLRNGQAKEAILKGTGDTWFSMTTEEYIGVIESFGFVKQYEEPLLNGETFYVYYREPSQVLVFNTYQGRRNGGNVYYAWQPYKCVEYWPLISSGGFRGHSGEFEDNIWLGYHDCREGLIHNLTQLEKFGNFVEPWPEYPFRVLTQEMDYHHPENYREPPIEPVAAADCRRWHAMPEEIKRIIGEWRD
jgi:hypothetical protein